jgi:hypothetical protein
MICIGCEKDLDDEAFGWRNKAKGKRTARCKPCIREYHKDWYEANRVKRIQQIRAYQKRVQKERGQFIQDLKSSRGCADCGERDPELLDFDHLGDKRFNISEWKTRAWADVLVEIEKCEVVCSHHHRKRTSSRRAAIRGDGALS